MINLIPTEAKKRLLREYWLRAVTVWFFLWSCAIFLGVTLLVPSYVLINLQTKAYAVSAQAANEKNENYESIAKELEQASKVAATVSEQFARPTMTQYIERINSLESADARVNRVLLAREGESVRELSISGIAANRQALADFRNRLRADNTVESVDLPISNLAKDKDIPFELTVTFVKPKTP